VPRALEPAEVADLGEQRERREGRDAAEAGEPRDGLRVRLAAGDGLELAVELGAALRVVLDLVDVVLEREPLALTLKLLLSEPFPESASPVAPAVEQASVPDEELPEPVPRRSEVLANVVPGADEVSNRLLLRARDGDRGELAGAEKPRELGRVASVGLHPVARANRDERRRDDLARDAHRCELSAQLEAARSRFVAAPQLVRLAREALERPTDHLLVVRDVGDDGLPRLAHQGRDDDALGVDVEADVSGNLLHGWLLRMRLWPRLVSRPRG
jgi:hypothetical protein